MLFSDYIVAFNHHTKLDSDRYLLLFKIQVWLIFLNSYILFFNRTSFLDFDAFGHISSLEQNFNPSKEDVKRKTALGMLAKGFFL
jgi:hypothetical protein